MVPHSQQTLPGPRVQSVDSNRNHSIPVRDYDLAGTLTSGQSFRWRQRGNDWEGIIGQRWVRLAASNDTISASTVEEVAGWSWLTDYLQSEVDLGTILLRFPDDEPMRLSVSACRGLRLLRQDPWECLASFILSSTKQIVQIEQIVHQLCLRFGERVAVPAGREAAFSFPTADRLARARESDLRACKMGFRAPNLLATARMVAEGKIDLPGLKHRTAEEAREQLMEFPGVGPKIANCVLLFAFGFQEAFPVDVWVKKALHQLYFPKRNPSPERLARFAATYFGEYAGYAQQYLFHYMRMKDRTQVRRAKDFAKMDKNS